MRQLHNSREGLDKSMARDLRSQLESLRANAYSDVVDEGGPPVRRVLGHPVCPLSGAAGASR